jgi:23S rRNA (uracil1939-C5)-methyltransferase
MKPDTIKPAHLVQIEKPVYGGSCLAHVEGKAIFVPLTLPGEEARIRIAHSKSAYATAEVEEIVTPSPQRVAPACPHFGVCGGCHLQHADYQTQLNLKKTILRETLERGGVQPPAQIDVLSATPWAYRNRIRLAFDASGRPGYRGRRSHQVIPVHACPIAAALLINAALAFAEVAKQVAPALKPTEIALFTNPAETALLVTVFTANAKKVNFDKLAEALRERIPTLTGAELMIETPGKTAQPPRSVARWGEPSLIYHAFGFDYRVDQGAFFQVNRYLVDALVDRVGSDHKGALAWDLFAGVGLFARQLTNRFDRVMAVEFAAVSMKALAANLKGTRAAPARATTVEFLKAHVNSDAPGQKIPDLIVVDPPRSGLGEEVVSMLARVSAPALAYVSCDPATLTRDLRQLLAAGYVIHSMALADLFPQTFHMETVVQLRRA